MFPSNPQRNSRTSFSDQTGPKSSRLQSPEKSAKTTFACFYPSRKFYPACINETGQALYSVPASVIEESVSGKIRLQLNSIRSHESFSTLTCEMMRLADYRLSHGEFLQSFELEAKKEYNANPGKYSLCLHAIQVSLKEANQSRSQICNKPMESTTLIEPEEVQEASVRPTRGQTKHDQSQDNSPEEQKEYTPPDSDEYAVLSAANDSDEEQPKHKIDGQIAGLPAIGDVHQAKQEKATSGSDEVNQTQTKTFVAPPQTSTTNSSVGNTQPIPKPSFYSNESKYPIKINTIGQFIQPRNVMIGDSRNGEWNFTLKSCRFQDNLARVTYEMMRFADIQQMKGVDQASYERIAMQECNANPGQYNQQLMAIFQSMQNISQSVITKNQSWFGGDKPQQQQQQPIGFGDLGAAAQQKPAFGQQQQTTGFGGPQGGGLFGQQSQPAQGLNQFAVPAQGFGAGTGSSQLGGASGGTGGFGQPQQPAQSTGLFGAQPKAQPQKAFRKPKATGAFGGQQQTQSTGLFGGANKGRFGQTQSFGQSTGFGQPQQPTTGFFGQPAPQTQLGAPGSAFGGGGGLFNQQQQQQPIQTGMGGGLFGAQPKTATPSTFGGIQQSPMKTSFYSDQSKYPVQINTIGQFFQPRNVTNDDSKNGQWNLKLKSCRAQDHLASVTCQMMKFADYQQMKGVQQASYESIAMQEYNANPGQYSQQLMAIFQSMQNPNQSVTTKQQSWFGQQQKGTQSPVFGNQNPQGAFGQPGFGQPQQPSQQTSAFGASAAQPQQQPGIFGQQTQPAMGAQPQQQTGGLFGKPQGTGLFGATTPQTRFGGQGTGLFGVGATQQPQQPQTTQSTGLFGAQSAQGAPGVGLFGSTQAQQPAQTGLFGQTPQAQPAQAATGLFGQAQPTQNGLFPAKQGSTLTSKQFAQPQQQNQPSGGLFGGQATKPVTGGLFGSAQPTAQSTLFGQKPQQQPGSMFGAQAATRNDTGLSGTQSQPTTTLPFCPMKTSYYSDEQKYPVQINTSGKFFQPRDVKNDDAKNGQWNLTLKSCRAQDHLASVTCQMIRFADYQQMKGIQQASYESIAMQEYKANPGQYNQQLVLIFQNLQKAKQSDPTREQSLFGQQQIEKQPVLFEQSAQSATGPQQQEQTGGLFGKPATTAPFFGNGGGLFGGSSTQKPQHPQKIQTTGLFGSQQAQATPFKGLEGDRPQANQTTKTSLQSKMLQTQPIQTATGLFGQAQPALNGLLPAKQQSTLTSTFAQPSGGLFGGQAAKPTTGAGFFAVQETKAKPVPLLFGGGQTQKPAGLLSQTPQSQPAKAATGLFGQTQAQSDAKKPQVTTSQPVNFKDLTSQNLLSKPIFSKPLEGAPSLKPELKLGLSGAPQSSTLFGAATQSFSFGTNANLKAQQQDAQTATSLFGAKPVQSATGFPQPQSSLFGQTSQTKFGQSAPGSFFKTVQTKEVLPTKAQAQPQRQAKPLLQSYHARASEHSSSLSGVVAQSTTKSPLQGQPSNQQSSTSVAPSAQNGTGLFGGQAVATPARSSQTDKIVSTLFGNQNTAAKPGILQTSESLFTQPSANQAALSSAQAQKQVQAKLSTLVLEAQAPKEETKAEEAVTKSLTEQRNIAQPSEPENNHDDSHIKQSNPQPEVKIDQKQLLAAEMTQKELLLKIEFLEKTLERRDQSDLKLMKAFEELTAKVQALSEKLESIQPPLDQKNSLPSDKGESENEEL